MTDAAQFAIRRGGRDEIPLLRPLWESLHEHHVAVAPHLRQLGPVRASRQSWQVRSELYEEWLAEPDAFVLLAERDEIPIGYALVRMRGPEESWETGERIAELETLAVLPGHRDHGTGRRLVKAVYDELRRIDVRQLEVGVIATNADAIRFYERLGLLPFTVSYIGNVPPADARTECVPPADAPDEPEPGAPRAGRTTGGLWEDASDVR
jgi:ribosomal protein S18 acetylase RimI-like enzyme